MKFWTNFSHEPHFNRVKVFQIHSKRKVDILTFYRSKITKMPLPETNTNHPQNYDLYMICWVSNCLLKQRLQTTLLFISKFVKLQNKGRKLVILKLKDYILADNFIWGI